MDDPYTFAPLNGHDDIIKELSEFENELSGKIGEDIILIAYTKKGAGTNNPFTSI